MPRNTKKDKPLYWNTCPSCVFLGCFQEKDLYFCRREGLVISEGRGLPVSIPVTYYRLSPYAWEAYDRAKERGLVK